MKKKLTLLLIFTFTINSAALAILNFRKGDIQIINPWVQATNGRNADLFMEIVNHGDEPDKLLRVQSNVSQLNELHLHSQGNDKITISKVQFIEIPQFGNRLLIPDGHHIMLTNLSHPLLGGNNVHITLFFERAGAISFPALIK